MITPFAVVARQKYGKRLGWLPLFLCCWVLVAFLLKTRPSLTFGQTTSSEMRERTGQATRIKVKDSLVSQLVISDQDKARLRKISIASERRNWKEVQWHFAEYSGNSTPIYTAVMNAALRCREHQQGALIYEKCRENCEDFEEQTFNAAMKIFGRLGDSNKVRKIWDEAREKCKLSHMMVSSRIYAAASEGDVETAAAMLDLMNTSNLVVDEFVLTSAIRSCWGWGKNQHRAAKYFWDLFPKFHAKKDIAAFTALFGAYKTAPLEDILRAKVEMKALHIQANNFFAETYLCSVVRVDKGTWHISGIVDALRQESDDRLQAAREALEDFEATGVELTGLCKDLKRGLQLVK